MSSVECFETRNSGLTSDVCTVVMVLDGAEREAWYGFLKDRRGGFRAVVGGVRIEIVPEGDPQCGDASS